jgi:hypothetical protein
MPFTCSICGEGSTRICVWCTKDACENHLCEKCQRCSDCCECEVRLAEPVHEAARPMVRAAAPGPESEPQLPPPDPEPEPAEPSPVREPEPATEPSPVREPEPTTEPSPVPDLDPEPAMGRGPGPQTP